MPTTIYNNPTGFDIGLINDVGFGYETQTVNNLSAYLDWTATQYCLALDINYISGSAEWDVAYNTDWVLYEFNQSLQDWSPFSPSADEQFSGGPMIGYITSITCEEMEIDYCAGPTYTNLRGAEFCDCTDANGCPTDSSIWENIPFSSSGGSPFNDLRNQICYDFGYPDGYVSQTLLSTDYEDPSILWNYATYQNEFYYAGMGTPSNQPFALDSLVCKLWGCTNPSACNYNSSATVSDGSCLEFDCAGECGGDDSTCVGCDGVANSGLVLDECGICDGENNFTTTTIPGPEQDCLGECGGTAVVDECGECNGGGFQQQCGCGTPGEFGIPSGFCDCESTIQLIYLTCYDQFHLDAELEGEVTIPACPGDICEDRYPYISFENIPEEYIEYGCTDTTACNYYFDANIDDGSCYYPFSSTHELLSGEHPLTRVIVPAFQSWWVGNSVGSENQYSFYNFLTAVGFNAPIEDMLTDFIDPTTNEQIQSGLFTRHESETFSGGFIRVMGLIDYELPGLTCPRIWANGEIVSEPFIPSIVPGDSGWEPPFGLEPAFDYIIDIGDDSGMGSYCMPDYNNNGLPDPVFKQRLNINSEVYYEIGFGGDIEFEFPILDLFKIPYPAGEDCSIFNSHQNLNKISTNWVRMEGVTLSEWPVPWDDGEYPYPDVEGAYFVIGGCMDNTPGRNVDVNNQCADGSTPEETGLTDNLPFSNYGLCEENQGYLSCNYNPDANTNTMCLYSASFTSVDYKYCNGTCISDDDNDGVCNEEEIIGCTESGACNYSPSATDDNGSCIFPTNCLVGPYQDSELICPGETCPPVEGCTDEGAYNYMEFYDIPCFNNNSCCIYAVSDCLDPIATNCHPACIQCNIPPFEQGWLFCQENSECGNGACCEYIMGCMDTTADNYNPEATQDDGTCEYTDLFIFNGITPTEVPGNSQSQLSLNYTMNGNLIMSDIRWQILDLMETGIFIVYPPAGNFDSPIDLTTPETEIIIQVPDVELVNFGVQVTFDIRDFNGDIFEDNVISYVENISTVTGTFIPGDVNIDGSVNVVDVMLIVNYIMNRETYALTYNQLIQADINSDGVIDVNDIVQIVNQIMNSGQMTPQQGEQVIAEVRKRLLKNPIKTIKQTQIRSGNKKQQLIDKIMRKQR